MRTDLIELTKESDENFRSVQILRGTSVAEYLNQVQVDSREIALRRAVEVLPKIFRGLHDAGVRFKMTDPGHGPGHMARDIANAWLLLSKIEGDPRHIFIGLLAGALHDVGCALVDRYADKTRVIRHAEIGALLVNRVLGGRVPNAGLNMPEIVLVSYAIAAHTHYLNPTEVTCADGQVRRVEPYVDLDQDGQPLYFVWYPRWIDRLDCVGPSFVARHYLTLAKPHSDYAGEKDGFVFTSFEKDMTPKFQEECGQRTMLDHLRMFSNSQTNDSPYGKWDYGRMIELRDRAKKRTDEVICAVRDLEKRCFTDLGIAVKSEVWHWFLAKKIEPTGKGGASADELGIMFEKLPEETRKAWCAGFQTVLRQYRQWVEEDVFEGKYPRYDRSSFLELVIPGMGESVIDML